MPSSFLDEIGMSQYRVSTPGGEVTDPGNQSEKKEPDGEPRKVEKEEVKPVVEKVNNEPKKEEVTQPTEVADYIKKINEYSGREFKSDDEIKTFFEETKTKTGRVDELSQELDQWKTEREAYNELVKYLDENRDKHDPLNAFFGGDSDKMKRHVITEALVAQGKNRDVVGKLIGADLNKIDSLSLLSLNDQLESTRLSGKDVETRKMILSDIGVDIDDPEMDIYNPKLTPEQQAKLDSRAGRIEKDLKNLMDQVQIPDVPNPVKDALSKVETTRSNAAKLTESWSDKGITEKLSKELDKIEIAGVEFEIDEKDKPGLLKEIAVDAARHGKEVNEENITLYLKAAKQHYVSKNIEKIISIAQQQRDAVLREEYDKKVYNGKPINTKESPEAKSDSTKKLEDALRRQGMIY